jgi:cyclic pyranopterin phosphate synthase
MRKKKLSHIDDKGDARMVDVGGKSDTERYARAMSRVLISSELYDAIRRGGLDKGDAFAVARIAGITAAKRTAELIPLCHPLPLTHVSVDVRLNDEPTSVDIRTEARTTYKTGVEMEALTAASVAALAIYDMGKSIDRGMVIESTRLLEKGGGRSGVWKREGS